MLGHKVAAYGRVSTTDQVTPEIQIQQIKEEYENHRGCKVIIEEVEKESAKEHDDIWNVEEYISKRQVLRNLIERGKKGEYDVLVVWKWDRLARDHAMQKLILKMMKYYGVVIEALKDTNDPLGRDVMGLINEAENRKKIDQTRLGMLKAVQEGRPVTGFPIGYKGKYKTINGKKKMINYAIDPSKKSVIQSVYRLRRAGKNYKDIERDTGIYYKTVKNILRNPTYVALQVYANQIYEGNWEAIIPLEQWKQLNPSFFDTYEDSRSKRQSPKQSQTDHKEENKNPTTEAHQQSS